MLIVGMGGTTRPGSSCESALRLSLDRVRELGHDVECYAAKDLLLPLYDPSDLERSRAAAAFVDAVRRADGLIVASPGYHGTISGLVKNALDYVEDCRDDDRPYLDGLPVGCITVAYGWQAAVNTLRTLRDVVHALRGWPTPYGAAINSAQVEFGDGTCDDERTAAGLRAVAEQVLAFHAEGRGVRPLSGSRGQ